MLKLSVTKVYSKALPLFKIQTYTMIQCTVIGHLNAKNAQIFGTETKSKIEKL